jgi:predicted acetyltransferase
MNHDTEYFTGALDADVDALIPIMTWAFAVDSEPRARQWFERAGPENLRVLRVGGRLAAGLAMVPMGQWFGGRSVTIAGIAGVMVDASQRGAGVGHTLMTQAMRELHRRRIPLATLYAATMPFYRGVGFETAGLRYRLRVPATMELRARAEVGVRTLLPEDEPAVEAAYRQRARLTSGWLDRGDYIWYRVRHPAGRPARGFCVEVDGRIEGYAYGVETRIEPRSDFFELHLSDLVATTRRSGLALLSWLRDHRSMADTYQWHGEIAGPEMGLIPERRVEATVTDQWMLRVTDVEAALADRGYPRGVQAELHVEVQDDLLAGNRGRWLLRVEDGRGRVERGGTGDLRIHAPALASLYTGLRSAEALAAMGEADGTATALATASMLFAGPAPSMPDSY